MKRVKQAFKAINRVDFLPRYVRDEAEYDIPIRIGYGQTNSQPTTVRRMLEWLDTQEGEHVLDVGAGSGWTSALLSYIVGEQGSVIATEIVPELVTFGRENCKKVGADNVKFYWAGKEFGRPQDAPYDRILVSASASELPPELVDQLNPGGRMVLPIGNAIHVIDKNDDSLLRDTVHEGYIFVPLIPG